jgi:hypothetical protein
MRSRVRYKRLANIAKHRDSEEKMYSLAYDLAFQRGGL